MSSAGSHKDAGFTLIEVLAALLIFSVAIVGLSQAGAQSARAVTALDAKMLAGIVADNQLVLARGRDVETGVMRGQTQQLSRAFNYTIETQPTDIALLFQLTVKVTDPKTSQTLEKRIGFKSVPAPLGTTPQATVTPNPPAENLPFGDPR